MKKFYALISRGKVAGSEILDKKLRGRTVVPVSVGMNQRLEATVSEMYDYNNLDENNNPAVINFPQVYGDTVRVQFYFNGPDGDNDNVRTSYEYKGRLFTSAHEVVKFMNDEFGYLAEFQIINNKLFVVSHMFPGKLTSVYVTIIWD